ncbi:hypothetical protein H6P81_018771 [Aristolochia fimbriata]|uniref:30S ribosomal protein S31, mitochondrial n=1 Tax=Aristolochia fimbriata TaxID=158543 RepID=A0AAV7E642_ARIFI|nr:hypothetical protein H6P81_018771 [Aristolochia fimbriata]
MAMMRWCGAVARRIVMSAERGPASGAGMPVLCGRGDKRTEKGKRFKGSYGNSRPKKDKKVERIKDKVEVPRSRILLNKKTEGEGTFSPPKLHFHWPEAILMWKVYTVAEAFYCAHILY